MKQVKTVAVQVSFRDAEGTDLCRSEVLIDTDVPHLRVGLLVDACQRAVANAVEELETNLAKSGKI